MNTIVAYSKLLDERPTIIEVLKRELPKCSSATMLANRVIAHDDERELATLIYGAAHYLWNIRKES